MTPHLLIVAILVTLSLIFRQWAMVTTYQLYLDARVDDAAHSTATQRFDLAAARVVPKITMRDDRVAFRTAIGRDSVVRAGLQGRGPARYEIRVHQGGVERQLCSGEVTPQLSIACAFPTGTGTLTIAALGDVTWTDLRIQRNLRVGAELTVLAFLLAAVAWWSRTARRNDAGARRFGVSVRASRAWAAALMTFASAAITIAAVEGALRAVGTRLFPGISAARHDLGDVTLDPRWQDSMRYGRRLSANFTGHNTWRQGDIIRMGFLSPALADGSVHRYTFHSDAEGFRNVSTRDRIDVAALGDSFTDALTMSAEAGWPMQLEHRLGVAVQNYGTAGFGPPQELLVLKDYALRHHPAIVVLAFFAGNDLQDAEIFERTGRTDIPKDHPPLGWPIKTIISRADTWFLTSALHAATDTVTTWSPSSASADAVVEARTSTGPSFDRGMFTVPVRDHVLRSALMPPYLNVLNFSETDLQAWRGWTLTRQSIGEMQRVSRAAGAQFVVMFLPFKSQVYLPLLGRAFSREALAAALQASLQAMNATADIDRMSRNRLALNALMQRFCDESGIPFLDTTDTLTAHADTGQNVYFPDDSHLNEAGEAVVAEALAAFLRKHLKEPSP